jgi:hypothetical protein
VSTVAFVIGGVSAALGVATLVVPMPGGVQAHASVGPAAVGVRGSF